MSDYEALEEEFRDAVAAAKRNLPQDSTGMVETYMARLDRLQKASTNLGSTKDPRAISAFSEFLTPNTFFNEISYDTAMQAALVMGLSKTQSSEAVPVLFKHLENIGENVDIAKRVRATLIYAIGELGTADDAVKLQHLPMSVRHKYKKQIANATQAISDRDETAQAALAADAILTEQAKIEPRVPAATSSGEQSFVRRLSRYKFPQEENRGQGRGNTGGPF